MVRFPITLQDKVKSGRWDLIAAGPWRREDARAANDATENGGEAGDFQRERREWMEMGEWDYY